MKTLVVYDSVFGNTKRIAETIAKTIPKSKLVSSKKTNLAQLKNLDLLIVGSPTYGGRPTTAILNFLNKINNGSLKKIKIAAFDTRFSKKNHGLGLKILMNMIGFAAPKTTKSLIAKGGTQIVEPQGFIVKSKEGPLEPKEVKKAETWAGKILKKIKSQ